MQNYICENCKKPASYKKINQVNILVFICKDCIITASGAKIANSNSKCNECDKDSNYIVINQLNRLKQICEECLLKQYQKI
ncbi:hypothetical protein [Spiroplasma endosymbiont of Cantharis nigra]|uniref:hypothetical protein n=1 Tax=Spiroplasma endosymbiont of Cantharis nigra TaxID=3066278 RepID=UPI0030D625CC